MDLFVAAGLATALVVLFAVFGLAMPERRRPLLAAGAVLLGALLVTPALVGLLGPNPARITLFWAAFVGGALVAVFIYRHNRQGRSTREH